MNAMSRISMTPEDLKTVTAAIRATWNYIGWDAAEAIGDDNKGALELCLDADRLTHGGCPDRETGRKAEAILRPLYDTVGWNRVINYLHGKIRLV